MNSLKKFTRDEVCDAKNEGCIDKPKTNYVDEEGVASDDDSSENSATFDLRNTRNNILWKYAHKDYESFDNASVSPHMPPNATAAKDAKPTESGCSHKEYGFTWEECFWCNISQRFGSKIK